MAAKMLDNLEEKRKLVMAKMSSMIKHKAPQSKSDDKTSVEEERKPNAVPVPHKNDNPKIKLSAYGLRPLYSNVNIESDKWLFTIDEESRAHLENPPSQQDGVSAEMEENIRYLGCELIQAGAILLKLPQTAAATGQILFQRFYYLKSLTKVHFEHMVMACLLLASKIEEAWRRPRDVINVFHRLEKLHRYRQRGILITPVLVAGIHPKPLDESYVKLRHQVIKAERRLLATLGFVVHVRHPHKLIFSYAHVLECVGNSELMQRAWSYMNDGLRTDMFVRYSAETIACACIFLAARTVEPKVKLPDEPFPWFELFDASDRDVRHIAMMLLRLYQRKRAPNWTKINQELDLLRFGPDGPPGCQKKEEEESKTDEKGKEKVPNKRMEHLRVNGHNDRDSSADERENRKDSRGRRDRTTSRSRSRSDSPRRRRDDRFDRIDRKRSPDPRGFVRRDDRRRGGGAWKGKKEKRRRERSRDRKDDVKERARLREREVHSALKRRRDSTSPPSRYRK